MKNLMRSMLFIPGNNPRMIKNAGVLGADSIILDLEDSVSIREKDAARILVKNALKYHDFLGVKVVVRINSLTETPWGYEDVKEIMKGKPDAIMIPKAQPEEVKILAELLDEIEGKTGLTKGTVEIFPIIETSLGVLNIDSIIKSSYRITGVLLGGADLLTELNLTRTETGEELLYVRSKIAITCRAANICVIDTPYFDVEDEEGLIKDTIKAKTLGMTGKAAIHPRQIETINKIFSPSQTEINYALKIVEAKKKANKEGKGVFTVDGKMVDKPIINWALNILKMKSGSENL